MYTGISDVTEVWPLEFDATNAASCVFIGNTLGLLLVKSCDFSLKLNVAEMVTEGFAAGVRMVRDCC